MNLKWCVTNVSALSNIYLLDPRFATRLVCTFLAFVALLTNSTRAQADVIFTDRAAFEAGLPAGFYHDDFTSAPNAIGSPAANYFGSGGSPSIGYSISSPGGLFIGPLSTSPPSKFIGPWEDFDDMLVTFNTSVYRVGISIALEDAFGPVAGSVIVDFGSGASAVLNAPGTGNFSFIGIYSDTPLTSMTIRGQGGGVFTNTTGLTSAVPEPGSMSLLALCLAACSIWRLRP